MIDRIWQMREGGHTERAHGIPHHGSYSVGKHSYDALSLLLILHPNPSMDLVKAMLWHDVAECWTGDVPAPMKWVYPEVMGPFKAVESALLHNMGVPTITDEDHAWLKACDALEFWLWAHEQLALGNRYVEQNLRQIVPRLERSGWMPIPCQEFYDRSKPDPWQRCKELGDG